MQQENIVKLIFTLKLLLELFHIVKSKKTPTFKMQQKLLLHLRGSPHLTPKPQVCYYQEKYFLKL